MRVNIYAEEITQRIELVEKQTPEGVFTGVRFYLELPVTMTKHPDGSLEHTRGPFIHKPGDDDSAAVTFWGKKELRAALVKALELLDAPREKREPETAADYHLRGRRTVDEMLAGE